jgi:hypothetical protein
MQEGSEFNGAVYYGRIVWHDYDEPRYPCKGKAFWVIWFIISLAVQKDMR